MYARTRTRPVVVETMSGRSGSYDPRNAIPPLPVSSVQVRYVENTMYDNPTPTFKKDSAQGRIVNTAMRKVGIEVIRNPRVLVLQQVKNPTAFMRELQLPSDPPLLSLNESKWAAEVLPDLVTQALTAARAATSTSVAAGFVSLGELGETMKMVASPLYALRNRAEAWEKFTRGWSKARRSSLYAGAAGLTTAANAWMTWRYGIMPLVYDIESIIKAAKTSPNSGRQTFRAKAKDSRESDSESSSPRLYWGDVYTDVKHVVERLSVRAGVLQDRNDGWASHWGVSPSNIPGMLFELTTLSFVLDWVSNTGAYVESLAYSTRGNTLAEWVTVDYESICTNVLAFQCHGNQYGAFAPSDPSGAMASKRYRETFRYPAGHLRSGVVSSIKMNWKRWLDAAAISKAVFSPLVSAPFNDAVKQQLRNNPSHRPLGRKK